MSDDSQAIPISTLTCTSDCAGNVILHLSDFHFVPHNNEGEISQRNAIENELIERVKYLPPEWQPNIICITGDISDKNNTAGYNSAKVFIERLLHELKISKNNLVICPGNHDVDVKLALKSPCPQNALQANGFLSTFPVSNIYEDIFHKYIKFCNDLIMSPYKYGKYDSFLFGYKKINNIAFIICNSCWFYKDSGTNELFIGYPLLEYLSNQPGILSKENITISLIHHPERELSQYETCRYHETDNPPAAVYLSEKADLVLTGDSHGLPIGTTGFCTTQSLNCGATLHESKKNSFCLIRVEKTHFVYQFYIFDSTRSDNRWIKDGDEKTIQSKEAKILFDNVLRNQNWIYSSLFNKGSQTNTETYQGGSTASSNIENSSIEVDMMNLLNKIGRYIQKHDYPKAIELRNKLVNVLSLNEQLLKNNFLKYCFTELADLEIKIVLYEHQYHNAPEDYSQVEHFIQKAHYYEKK